MIYGAERRALPPAVLPIRGWRGIVSSMSGKRRTIVGLDWRLAAALAFFAGTRLALLFLYDHYWSDTPLYRMAAALVVKGHYIPYHDFKFPYPPLSLPLVVVPFLLAEGMTAYRFVFQCEMALFDIAALAYVLMFAGRAGLGDAGKAAAVALYAVLGLALGHLIYDRLDVALAVVFIGIAYHLSAPSNSGERCKRAVEWRLASLLNCMGALLKIVPALLVPVHVIVEFFAGGGKRPRDAIRPFAFIVVPFVLLMFIVDRATFNEKHRIGLISSMAEHGERGIQMESSWATPFMLRNAAAKTRGDEIPYPIRTNHGAQHLDDSAVPKSVLLLSKYAGFALLAVLQLAVGLWLFARPGVRGAVSDPVWILSFVTACLLTTIATQRVFSPQYAVWLLPSAAILPFAARSASDRWPAAVLSAVIVLTFMVFDYGYEGLVCSRPGAVGLAAARNALCLVCAAVFALRLFKWRPVGDGSVSEEVEQ